MPEEFHALAQLWAMCRPPPVMVAGAGGAIQIPAPPTWPDAGGINQQSAYVVEAFGVMDNLAARLRERRGEG